MRPRIQLETLLRGIKLAAACALAWQLARWLGLPDQCAPLSALFAALLVQPGRRFAGLLAVSRLFLIVMSAVFFVSLQALLGSTELSLLLALPGLALLLQRFRTLHTAPLAFLTVWWLSSQPKGSPEAAQVVALGLGAAACVDALAHLLTLPLARAWQTRELRSLGRELAEVGEQVGAAVLAPNVRSLRDARKRLAGLSARLAEAPRPRRRRLAIEEAARRLGQLAGAAIELRALRLPPKLVCEPPAGALGAALTTWARAFRGCFDGRSPGPQTLAEVAQQLEQLVEVAPSLRGWAFDLRALELSLADLAASGEGPGKDV